MNNRIRRIAVNTGGGDAPGLNAVIRAVVLTAERRGWEVLGIQRGYEGLLDTSKIVQLDRNKVRGITHLGGTILGTSNRGNPFEIPMTLPDGTTTVMDRSDEVVENYERLGIDALVAIGGDGSMRIAQQLEAKGMSIVGVPKTIDNDLQGTLVTFGFDTAVTVATDAVGRLHSTAEAHRRVFTVEVMGRYAGWIALHTTIAGGADVALIPEIPFDIDVVCRKILDREARGRHFAIAVVSEGAKPAGGEMVTKRPKEGRSRGGAGGDCGTGGTTDRGEDRQGDPQPRARAPAAGRDTDAARPHPGSRLWRRGRAGDRRRRIGCHGGPRSARRQNGAARGRHPADENGAARLRHSVYSTRDGDLPG